MEQLIQRNLFLLSNSLKYLWLGHFTFFPFIPFIFVLRRPYGFGADFLLAGVRRVPALLSIDLAQLHGQFAPLMESYFKIICLMFITQPTLSKPTYYRPTIVPHLWRHIIETTILLLSYRNININIIPPFNIKRHRSTIQMRKCREGGLHS